MTTMLSALREQRAAEAQDTAPALPPGTPLLAKTPRTAELFGISERQLYNLRQRHADLAALTLKIGRDVYFDVPRVYAWFGRHLGEGMDT